MKKILALGAFLAMVFGLATPIQAAGPKYTAYQKTLSSFSSSATGLTSQQKAQVKATVDANPAAEKFICTGIRYYSQPMSVNIIVRNRAKAACEYAKELNPSLSTWFQNKPTQARSYAGKVLLTVKSPDVRELANQSLGDVDVCKIKQDTQYRKPGEPVFDFIGEDEIQGRYTGNATAFPFIPTTLPTSGEIEVSFVYVDWQDLAGTAVDFKYYQQQIEKFEEFYWMVSEHKLKMNIDSSENWFRIPGSYEDFTLTQQEEAQRGAAPKKQVFYDAVVAASDANTDYSKTQIVFVAIPRSKSVFFHGGPHEFNFDHNGFMKTSEGSIYNIAAAGDWFLKNDTYEPPWVYYVHETGHMLGVPHQANEEFKDGRIMEKNNPISGYEIMANQGGASRTISSWLRWLAGWLDDDQVACITKEEVTDNYFELHPINGVTGEVESLVIKISDTKAVVVESRRFDPQLDRKTRNSKKGLLVYTVDATKGSAQGNQALLSPRDITKYISEPTWRSGSELDAVFFQGDSVEIEGIRIEASSIGSDSDVVRVTSTNN
jgi:M6 family metalloprotease-like protein